MFMGWLYSLILMPNLFMGTLNVSLELFSIFAIRQKIVVSEMGLKNRIVNTEVFVFNLYLSEL